MELNATDMSIQRQGWYENGEYKGGMRDDKDLKQFKLSNVLVGQKSKEEEYAFPTLNPLNYK